MRILKNPPILATASIYLVGITAYISDFNDTAEKLLGFCSTLNVSPSAGAFILFIPLFLLIAKGFIKSRVESSSFHRNEEYNPGRFRLAPYGNTPKEISDYQKHERTDKLEHEISDWILHANYPILFLTGKSGTGKSSIISASVMPELKKNCPNLNIVTARIFNAPIEEIKVSLNKLQATKTDTNQDLYQIIANISKQAPLLLIVDQFEEILILHDQELRKPLENLLHKINNVPIPGFTLLFICREDYLPELERSTTFLPQLRSRENWRQIGPFNQDMAINFFNSSGLSIGNHLMEAILNEAAEMEECKGLYRPIVLNMMGMALERKIRPDNQRRLIFGNKRNMLKRFIEEEIGKSSKTWRILAAMITEAGTKNALSTEDISKSSGEGKANAISILRKLESSGMVRKINETTDTWEISHDFIAQIFSSLLTTWKYSATRIIKRWATPSMLGLLLAFTLTSPYQGIIQKEKLKTYALVFSERLVASIEFGDRILAHEVLGSIKGDEYVYFASVFIPDGDGSLKHYASFTKDQATHNEDTTFSKKLISRLKENQGKRSNSHFYIAETDTALFLVDDIVSNDDLIGYVIVAAKSH